jgi:hypothetical protein
MLIHCGSRMLQRRPSFSRLGTLRSVVLRQIFEPRSIHRRRCSHVAGSWAHAPEEEWRCGALRRSRLVGRRGRLRGLGGPVACSAYLRWDATHYENVFRDPREE